MRARLTTTLLLALPLLSSAEPPPPLEGAKLTRRSAAAGLTAALAGVDGWVGWSVPAQGDRAMCCWDSFDSLRRGQGGSCRLDGRHGTNISNGDGALTLAGNEMRLFARLTGGRARDVRVYSAGCRVDARGATVAWFDEVDAADSVKVLESWAGRDEEAVPALALHAVAAADAALDRLLASGTASVRGPAAFWLGAARGRHGFETLRARLGSERDEDVREQMLTGLAQSDEPGAIDALLAAARNHGSAATRGHALFWVSQQAGERAAAAIEHAITHDPDEEVKEKAVFALSQLPKDQGVPLLLRTMQQNRNPEVRKQAAFWLGQSNDPRALAYFEQLLTAH